MQDLPQGYRVRNGCHNCKDLRRVFSYDGSYNYCANVQPAPKVPQAPINEDTYGWKRYVEDTNQRRVEAWATCDHWEAKP